MSFFTVVNEARDILSIWDLDIVKATPQLRGSILVAQIAQVPMLQSIQSLQQNFFWAQDINCNCPRIVQALSLDPQQLAFKFRCLYSASSLDVPTTFKAISYISYVQSLILSESFVLFSFSFFRLEFTRHALPFSIRMRAIELVKTYTEFYRQADGRDTAAWIWKCWTVEKAWRDKR